jgi:hypothetical protein
LDDDDLDDGDLDGAGLHDELVHVRIVWSFIGLVRGDIF